MPGNRILGHYRILREAGRGGMSMVYEAEDTRIGRRVALKVLSAPLSLPPEQRDAMITRLRREARAIARLSHPNIVTIFDIGEDSGQHFIVMEFLEGQTLRERIGEGLVPPEEVSAILDQIASGLDAVHAANIIHRDIKPSNVMLLPGGLVKVMDFGVARQHEDTQVTQVGSIVGSPAYMAPEQTEGKTSTAASDLWSLGVILYEMLVGRPPFAGESVPRILYQVAHEKPLVPPGLTPAVREVLGRALDKNPSRRYGSAGQMAADFHAALSTPNRPAVSAHPREGRLRLDRRPIAGAAGLLLLFLLATLFTALHLRRMPVPPKQISRLSARRPSPLREASSPTVSTVQTASTPPQQTRRLRHPKRAPRRIVSPGLMQEATAYEPPPSRPAHQTRAHHHVVPASPKPSDGSNQARADSPAPKPPGTESPHMASTTGVNLLGTWHGILTNHRATIHFDHRAGDDYTGMMSVHTGGYDARVAVTGRVSPRTGKIEMRETRRLPGTAAHAWDLGTETGHIEGDGRISGTGTDVKHREGTWSFSR